MADSKFSRHNVNPLFSGIKAPLDSVPASENSAEHHGSQTPSGVPLNAETPAPLNPSGIHGLQEGQKALDASVVYDAILTDGGEAITLTQNDAVLER